MRVHCCFQQAGKGGQRDPPHLSHGAPGGMRVGEGRWKNAPPLERPGELVRRLVDSAVGFPNTYPLDSDLSGGERYSTLE